jgi:hypothetical protein
VAAKTKRARIKLLKHVLIEGKHTEAGSTLEMDRHKATELVSVGQAEFVDEDNEDDREVEKGEQYGVRIESPTNGDPGPREVTPNKPKITGAGTRKHA